MKQFNYQTPNLPYNILFNFGFRANNRLNFSRQAEKAETKAEAVSAE